MNKKKQGPLLYIQSTTNVSEINEDTFLYNSREAHNYHNSFELIEQAIEDKQNTLLFYLSNGQNIVGRPIKKTTKEVVILKLNSETYTIKINNIEKVTIYQESKEAD